MITVLTLSLGVALLYVGAEWLVRGAARIAAALDVSPLVIGLTVVAFGTSMPELVAGVVAAWAGTTDIVLGNVFGSNVANVGLILGSAAVLRTVPVRMELLRREVPIMLAATVAVHVLAANGVIGRGEGAALFVGLVAFTFVALRWARRERSRALREFEQFESRRLGTADRRALAVQIVWVVAGLGALTGGAHLLVNSAVQLARALGVSEFLIAVSMVAVGTSLPELATSIVAALRGESDVLVGASARGRPDRSSRPRGRAPATPPRPLPVAPVILLVDLPVVAAFSLAMMATLWSHRGVVRWEGALLVCAYVTYLVLRFG